MEKFLVHFQEYLQMRNFKDQSVKNYVSRLRHFFSYLNDELNIQRLGEVTPEIINGYQQQLFTATTRHGRPMALQSQAAYLISLKTFFRFLVQHDHILYNPTALLELPRRDRNLPRSILTKQEVQRLLAQPDLGTLQGYRDRTILEIFYATGIRAREMRQLDVYDPDISKGTLMIRDGKGNKDRVVPLTATAAEFIDGYLHNVRAKLLRGGPTDTLILSNAGQRLSVYCLQHYLQRYLPRAKISKPVTCHVLRHTCATHLLAGGADIRYIQQLLGHASLATTQIYTRVEISDLKRAHRKYHPREKF